MKNDTAARTMQDLENELAFNGMVPSEFSPAHIDQYLAGDLTIDELYDMQETVDEDEDY